MCGIVGIAEKNCRIKETLLDETSARRNLFKLRLFKKMVNEHMVLGFC